MDLLKGRRGRRGSDGGHGHHWAAKCKLDFSKEFEQKGIPLQDNLAEKNAKDTEQLAAFFGMEEADMGGRLEDGIVAFAASAFTTAVTMTQVSPEGAALKAKSMLWRKVYDRRAKMAQTLGATREDAEEPGPPLPLTPPAPPPAAAAPIEKVPSPMPVEKQFSITVTTVPEQRRTRGISFCDLLTTAGATEHSMEGCDMPTSARFGKSAHERIHRPVTPRDLLDARPPQVLSIGDFPPIFRRNRERPQESHYNYFSRRIPEERPELRKVMELRAVNTRRLFDGRERVLPAMSSEQASASYSDTTESPPSSSGSPKTARGRSITEPKDLVLPSATKQDSHSPSSRPPSSHRSPQKQAGADEAAKKPDGPGRRNEMPSLS